MYQLKPGWAVNPLRKFRNMPCPCGSGVKSKRCHGRLDVLPSHVAIELARFVERVTDNEKRAKR